MTIRIICICTLLLGIQYCARGQNYEQRGLITDRPLIENFEFIPYTEPTGPPAKAKKQEAGLRGSVLRPDAVVLDSLKLYEVIPAGETFFLKYDQATNKLLKVSRLTAVTDLARAAIEASPEWVRDDLFDNFRRLDTNLQNRYAEVIINTDTTYRDEVAFQFAHLSTNMDLQSIDKMLPVVNAQGIYQIAPELEYVKLVEHGSAAAGDWYTTTTYRIINAEGDSVWREIPRDVYYWWVLMPNVYEEMPAMDSTAKNEFWRTHVYENADSGYPVLKDVLRGVKVFWDGRNYHWDNRDGATPLPFSDTMMAVQVLGRWVAQTITEDALPPRPVQPNITLYDHNGNCGEIQQLQTSGGRAGLFPLMPVCTWPGDHIWNEIYWPDSSRWAFYQIARVGGPTDINWNQTWPTSSCITAIRGDGYRWMVNENYNPVCEVTVVVRDAAGAPVDGAEVVFVSTPYFDTHSVTQSVIGYWGHTNAEGELTVKLGTDFNYFIRADWENGHYPANPGLFYTLQYFMLNEGGHKYVYLNAGTNEAEDLPYSEVSAPEPGEQSLYVEYEVPYQITYGGSYWDYPLWQDNYHYAYKSGGGKVSALYLDETNYGRYLDEEEIEVFSVNPPASPASMWMNVAEQKDYYLGLSNRRMVNLAQYTNLKAYLLEGAAAVSVPQVLAGEFSVSPNPSADRFVFKRPAGSVQVQGITILDALGKEVTTVYFAAGGQTAVADLSALPAGLYFARISTETGILVLKLVRN